MSAEADADGLEPIIMDNYDEVIEELTKEVQDLHLFKDLFFENHPIEMAMEKNDIIKVKRDEIAVKFEAIDEASIPMEERAMFLYLKGRCYNTVPLFDPKALECLSKAVKLGPMIVGAWNELGECYWKNSNIKEAKMCFERALNLKRDPVTLRSLSILLRQDNTFTQGVAPETIIKSVEYAKEAVAVDTKDGQSWSVLGNAYLCQFFLVAQNPNILKLSLSAYKQAWHDRIAQGHPDMHYNKGMALKYEERYAEALEAFVRANELDPPWLPPIQELKHTVDYLNYVDQMLRNKGKIKAKKIKQMVKSMQPSMFGDYQPGSVVSFNQRKVTMEHVKLAELLDGENHGKVVMGRVIGSIHTDNAVPFTFGMVDESMCTVAVNVYNWADGRGVIIGDCVAIPEPPVATHTHNTPYPEVIANEKFNGLGKDNKVKKTDLVYDFRSIRVNDPTRLRVNGKRVSKSEFASTRVSSTYEAH